MVPQLVERDELKAVAAIDIVRASVVSGGVLCIAGTAALALLLPRFVAYDARTPATGVPPPAHGPAPAPR